MLGPRHALAEDDCPRVVRPLESRGRPSRSEAEAAVRTLIRWAGDDPGREGLIGTPERVVKAYEEWFAGYGADPETILERTFGETGSYGGPIILRGIEVQSFCEHHMAPIGGLAHIAYHPRGRVVGISKLVRLVEAFARRLQIQERLTAEIGEALERVLEPEGVAVTVTAEHGCMASRGVNQQGLKMVTTHVLGRFREEPQRSEILAALKGER